MFKLCLKVSLFILGGFSFAACHSRPEQVVGPKNGSAETKDLGSLDAKSKIHIDVSTSHLSSWDFKEIEPLNKTAQKLNELVKKSENLSDEDFWALSQCRCLYNLQLVYLLRLIRESGALPDALVPQVREEIYHNDTIKALSYLPDFISQITGGLPNDATFNKEVYQELNTIFAKSFPGGFDSKDLPNYTFSMFTNFKNSGLKKFNLSDQMNKWLLVYSLPHIWENVTPPKGLSPAIQSIHLSLSLAEWQYMFGLKESSQTHAPYGGLAQIIDNNQLQLGAIDPSKDDRSFYFSGNFTTIFNDRLSKFELALKEEERWQHEDDSIDLGVQSRLWAIAARAYQRLRPTNRQYIQSFFNGDDPLFPLDTHKLPLGFLSTMKTLLDGKFINTDTHFIGQYTSFQESFSAGLNQPASLSSLVKLLRALNAWTDITRDVSQDQLDDDTLATLSSASDTLMKAAQLTVQTILSQHLRLTQAGAMELYQENIPILPGLTAETITALMETESSLLPSLFLKEKIALLLDSFISASLAKSANQFSDSMSAADLLWLHTLKRTTIEYFPELKTAPWVTSLDKANSPIIDIDL